MEIASLSAGPGRVPGIPSKPLDNPKRPKPAAPADLELARTLDGLLRQMPALSDVSPDDEFPLLSVLFRHDERNVSDLARPLLFLAAANHRTADERRTAEYLLRHRHEVAVDGRSALSLLMAARGAAEMDVRRVRLREVPTATPIMVDEAADTVTSRVDDISVGETVIRYLCQVTGYRPITSLVRARLLDAVAVALELAERHALNSGAQPSVLAMRSDARKDARLVTHLRNEFRDDRVARSLARLLVGADGTSIETSLLWWAAQQDSLPAAVPLEIRTRWVREFANADPSGRSRRLQQRRRKCALRQERCADADDLWPA